MNRKLVCLFLACWLAPLSIVRAQTLDQEISVLAGKLSKALAAQGFKHVAAVDFTDLQGQPTELGRFLSEQLAVEIVSGAGVSMVDRANIKSILAEHKLTEEGLVNPANAKKLGQFAGVDAILIGNVTALDDGVVLMVKAIATSSADIVAAGRAKFPKTSEIQQLLNRGISSNNALGVTPVCVGTYQTVNAIATKDYGSLRVVLKSALPAKLKDRNGRDVNGARLTFDFVNLDLQKPLAVAGNAEVGQSGGNAIGDLLRTTLLDDRGSMWRLQSSGLTGLGVVSIGPQDESGMPSPADIARALQRRDAQGSSVGRWNQTFVWGSTSSLAPGQSASVVMIFVQDAGESASSTLPQFFEFASELVLGVASANGRFVYSVKNVSFDRVSIGSTR
jgi:hypothetical protein